MYKNKSICVVIPALNEEKTIADVIRRIPCRIDGIEHVNATVIDDGSTDRTAEFAREAGAEVISNGVNRGLGLTFATGVDAALARGADVIVNMDGDGQFRPEDIPKLIAPILENRADFVTCTRFGNPEWIPDMPGTKLWGNRMMCRIINCVTRAKPGFTDVSCGYRAYSRDTALKLNLFGRFTYTQETFIDLAAKDVRMTEVPLQVRGERQHGKSRIARSLLKYGMQAGMILLRSARDLHPLRFFGAIGGILLLLGLAAGVFVFGHWLQTGRTTPYQSLLLGSGVSLILAFILFVIALLADMIGRLRKTVDHVFYLEKRRKHNSNANTH